MSNKYRLGKLPPKHIFFLNPLQDDRFTRCPECQRLTKTRKNPLLVSVGTNLLMVFNISGKYCPNCDLLIVHKDIFEEYLVTGLTQRKPKMSVDSYMILGTVERKFWRDSKKRAVGWQEAIDNLHDFIKIVDYKPY